MKKINKKFTPPQKIMDPLQKNILDNKKKLNNIIGTQLFLAPSQEKKNNSHY